MISTKVAIAGLAAKAGSPFNDFTIKGNKAPKKVEQIICNDIDRAITKEM